MTRSLTGIFGPRTTTVDHAELAEKKLDEVLRRRTGPPPTPVPPPLPPPARALAITVDDDEAVTQPFRWLPSLHPL